MLPGPVFFRELVTTARRRRYYALRVLYGAVLLLILWGNYSDLPGGGGPQGAQLLRANLGFFTWQIIRAFAAAQIVAVLVMTPALVAGVIADEKQRKTLHYLLASRLTGAEIVLGKLAARLLHVGVLLAIGPPVIALLSLFGGVDPKFVAQAYLVAATTALFSASLSILVSSLTRTAREAIFLAYILELGWLVLPMILSEAPPETWYGLGEWIVPINAWVLASNPLTLTSAAMTPNLFRVGTSELDWAILRVVAAQTSYALAMVGLAIFFVRRAYRREGGGGRLTVWSTPRRWKILARPACGNDPMAWKERHVARAGKVGRLIVMPLAVVAGFLVSYFALEGASDAFAMVRKSGYGPQPTLAEYGRHLNPQILRDSQGAFNDYLAGSTGVLYVLWLLGVVTGAAGAVTTEIEDDTWISLTSTTLDGPEILRAKRFGAVWRGRGLAILIVALWGLGVVSGAIHPLGFAAAFIVLAATTWFFAALGIWISLHSRSTPKALAWGIAALWLFGGGLLLLPLPDRIASNLLQAGGAVPMLVLSLLSYRDVEALTHGGHNGPHPLYAAYSRFASGDVSSLIGLCVVELLGFAGGAWGLTYTAARVFDRRVGRPERARSRP